MKKTIKIKETVKKKDGGIFHLFVEPVSLDYLLNSKTVIIIGEPIVSKSDMNMKVTFNLINKEESNGVCYDFTPLNKFNKKKSKPELKSDQSPVSKTPTGNGTF